MIVSNRVHYHLVFLSGFALETGTEDRESNVVVSSGPNAWGGYFKNQTAPKQPTGECFGERKVKYS